MNSMELAKQYMEQLYGQSSSSLETTDPELAAIKKRLIYGEIYAE